jgi:uncharacterized protein YggE
VTVASEIWLFNLALPSPASLKVLTELEKAKKVHATRMARMQRVMRELQTDEIEQSDVD